MSFKEYELKAFQSLAFPVRVGTGMKPEGIIPNSPQGKIAKNLCKVTVILTGSRTNLVDAIKAVRDLKSMNCYITLVLSKGAEEAIDVEYVMNSLVPDRVIKEDYREGIKNLIENTDICLVPSLTQNTLTKTAMGIQDEISSIVLWQCLLNGVKTVINTGCVFKGWFDADLNPVMKRVLEGYVKTLVSFGAKVDDGYDYAKYLESAQPVKVEKISKAAPSKESGTISGVKLITAEYIKSIGGGELVVQKGQLVTPLAADVAKELGITIVKS